MSSSEEFDSSVDNFSSQDSDDERLSSNDSDANMVNYSIESEDDFQSQKISHINAILKTNNDQELYNSFYCGYNEDTRYLKHEQPKPIMLKAYYSSDKTLDEMLDEFDNDRASGKVLYHWKLSSPESEIIKISFVKVNGIGCQHFTNNCELQCQQCKKFVGCGYCHEQQDELTEHDFVSSGVLKCLHCSTEQPTTNQICQQCKIQLYKYLCIQCGYSSMNIKFFHCDKCGCCYKGDSSKFTHCDKCNTCVKNMDLIYHQKQTCGQNKNQQDICTVCLSKFDNMLMKSVQLVCTHLIHQSCFARLLRAGIKNCSLCQKPMKSRLDGAAEYQKFISIYAITEVQQMKIDTYHNVQCNSCKEKFVAHWHPKGYFCPYCDSIECVQQDLYLDSKAAVQKVKNQYKYMREQRNVIPIYPLILWPKDTHDEMIDMIQDYVNKYKDFWIACRKKMTTCPFEMPLHELVNAFCLVRDIDEYLGFAALNLCHARKIFPKPEEDGKPSKLDEIVCGLMREIRSSKNQDYE